MDEQHYMDTFARINNFGLSKIKESIAMNDKIKNTIKSFLYHVISNVGKNSSCKNIR